MNLSIFRTASEFLKNPKVRNLLIYLFFALSVFSCFSTYLLFSNITSFGYNIKQVIVSLYFDIAFILVLLLLGSQKIIEIWSDRHRKGSRLTFRLISIFSLVSIVPSVMMCVFSAVFFHSGIESWLNDRNSTVLQESLNVADSYFIEHKRNALQDCAVMSKTVEYQIEKMGSIISYDYSKFSKEIGFLLDDLCGLKSVSACILLDSSLNVIGHSKYSVNLHFLSIHYEDIKKVEMSEKKCLILNNQTDENTKSIFAISCFKNGDDYMYVIIEKRPDSNILAHAKHTKTAFAEYYQLLEERGSLEIAFILIFFIVGILLLMSSIFIAIVYSWRIVKPISNLIDVSEEIIGGRLDSRAQEDSTYEEIALLSKTFNQMVDIAHSQKEDLEKINKQMDEKIHFISGVLSGVSSGVIGIENNAIYIWNTAAEKLLGKSINFGEHIANTIPGIENILLNHMDDNAEKEIQYQKEKSIFIFSIKIENISSSEYNRYVITFDDLTNMIVAQRKAAWSGAARRVAHEIKNPLTPIQLAAERISRKYLKQITNDSTTFTDLINVIIRQVGNIKRLIDEFNFFARLPEPILKKSNPLEICKQAVLLMQNSESRINIVFSSTANKCMANVDERLLHQCIVNLIQNAINALETIDAEPKYVWVDLRSEETSALIEISDNGPGLPDKDMELLATPYFSLMPKGTGLGLSIVKKIVDDHGGELLFSKRQDNGGAKVTISIPLSAEGKQ